MQLFIKCYLSKNFINLGKQLRLRWKKKSRKPHKLLQFCFNSQEQKYCKEKKNIAKTIKVRTLKADEKKVTEQTKESES